VNRLVSMTVLLGPMAVLAGLLFLLWDHSARELLVSLGAVVFIAASLLLERFWPHRRTGDGVPRSEIAGDIGSFVLVFGLMDSALKWLTPFLVVALFPVAGLSGVNLGLQTLLVALWIEFAAWGSHWAHHRFKSLWALHAMHHSTEHLYTLNNFRFHPLNHAINHFAMLLPPLLLGTAPEAILIYSALALPVLLLQHSNVAFDFGPLNRVLNTNDLHRWHHSADPSEGTKNLGRATVIWDHVFGTYLRPDTGTGPKRIGLFQISRNFPDATRFWAQLLWPFSKRCCT
jgi:sterol desaturase/sphingolipid hydroxylase (fatty acid hydroxylase superfamily)